MKKKRIQVIALLCVLVVVVALGILFLTRGSNSDSNQPDSKPVKEPAAQAQVTVVQPETLAECMETENIHYIAQPSVKEEYDKWPVPGYERLLEYNGKICRLLAKEKKQNEDFVYYDRYDLVSVEDNTVIKSWDSSCFIEPGMYEALTVDEEGNLWSLCRYNMDGGYYALSLCEPGVSEENAIRLPDPPHKIDRIGCLRRATAMQMRGDYVLAECYDSDVSELIVWNLKSGSVFELPGLYQEPGIQQYCLGEDGYLYIWYFDGENVSTISKYSLTEQKEIWTMQDTFTCLRGMWYVPDTGLFVCENVNGLYKIYCINSDTGDSYSEFLNTSAQCDVNPWKIRKDGSNKLFAIDRAGNFYVQYSQSMEPAAYIEIQKLVPRASQVSPEDVITLTITAPYVVDSVQGAINQYQIAHPEIQVEWDTQFISREDFKKNGQNYREQITLRTMNGDTGDLQMILGANMEQSVITDTDAFTDLVPYLDKCPFKNDLAWSYYEALRGKDGAIRAVPVAVCMEDYMYNQTLLEQLGRPIDPNTVRWSELLDLAIQWKENGTDLSLTSSVERSYGQDILLRDVLLANLYAAKQDDGTVKLDTPEFRELLQKLKAVWGSEALVREDGCQTNDGSLDHALFMMIVANYGLPDRVYFAHGNSHFEGLSIYSAPLPSGETSDKRQAHAFAWGIPASSQKKDAAWDLLQFIISENGLPGYIYTADTCSTNNRAFENQFNEIGCFGADDLLEQLQYIRSQPIGYLNQPLGWQGAVYDPIHSYLDGNVTLDEAIESAQNNWERLVKG